VENNPYAAPRAAVSDLTPERPGRPVLVWIISLFMAFGVVGGIVSSLAALIGTPIGGAETARYMTSVGIGPLDHAWSLVLMALSAVAYVDFFRLKRRSLPLLAALFAAAIAYSIVKAGFSAGYRGMMTNPPGLWTVLAGWGVNLAILVYAWRLRAKDVLR
jgi:hypothetical protein